MEIPDHLTCLLRNLYAGKEAKVRTGYGTTDWFQIGKGVHQGCILLPCLFNLYAEYIMWNAGLDEAQVGIKVARRNINNLRYTDDTTLKAESKELKRFLKGKRGEWKSWLKTQHSKNEYHGIQSHHSMTNRWGKYGNSDRLYFLALQNTADGDCSHEIKRHLLLGRKAMTNLESLLCQQRSTESKLWFFQYGYESWTIKKAEHQRIDAFELWCWRRLLRVCWTSRWSNQSILKKISPEYSLEVLILKLKFQSFENLMQRGYSLEKTLMLGKIEGKRRDRGWDGWMASSTQWTWVWAKSGR